MKASGRGSVIGLAMALEIRQPAIRCTFGRQHRARSIRNTHARKQQTLVNLGAVLARVAVVVAGAFAVRGEVRVRVRAMAMAMARARVRVRVRVRVWVRLKIRVRVRVRVMQTLTRRVK
jgi:forkhead box protein K